MMWRRFWTCGLLTALLAATLTAQDLYSLDNVVEIKVVLTDPEWNKKLHALKAAGEDERLVGDVWVNGKKYAGAGIRYKGNSSYNSVLQEGKRKLPFNIKVNFTDKAQKLPGGYTSLKLSNSFRDPTFLREILAYEIAGKYMPAPRSTFAKVYINKEYFGLYQLTESVDDDLLEGFFGSDDGVLIKCDPLWDVARLNHCPEGDKASLQYLGDDTLCYRSNYEVKSDHGWDDLVELTYILNREPERLEQVLNIDQTLWMLAFNNVTVNLDSYIGHLCHNYYLYRDTSGIFQPVVWDMNLCFGGFRHTGIGQPLADDKLPTLSLFLHFKEQNDKRPLVMQLLKNELYRKIYIAHVRTMLRENFNDGQFTKRVLALQQKIAPLVKADSNRLYSYEDFERNMKESVTVDKNLITGLTTLMEKRSAFLLQHPLLQEAGPAVADVAHKVSGNDVSLTVQAQDAEQVWLLYRAGSHRPWKRLPLDAGEGNAWAAKLPVKDIQQYYIVAEGEKAATVQPERASKEFYEVAVK